LDHIASSSPVFACLSKNAIHEHSDKIKTHNSFQRRDRQFLSGGEFVIKWAKALKYCGRERWKLLW